MVLYTNGLEEGRRACEIVGLYTQRHNLHVSTRFHFTNPSILEVSLAEQYKGEDQILHYLERTYGAIPVFVNNRVR